MHTSFQNCIGSLHVPFFGEALFDFHLVMAEELCCFGVKHLQRERTAKEKECSFTSLYSSFLQGKLTERAVTLTLLQASSLEIHYGCWTGFLIYLCYLDFLNWHPLNPKPAFLDSRLPFQAQIEPGFYVLSPGRRHLIWSIF